MLYLNHIFLAYHLFNRLHTLYLTALTELIVSVIVLCVTSPHFTGFNFKILCELIHVHLHLCMWKFLLSIRFVLNCRSSDCSPILLRLLMLSY